MTNENDQQATRVGIRITGPALVMSQDGATRVAGRAVVDLSVDKKDPVAWSSDVYNIVLVPVASNGNEVQLGSGSDDKPDDLGEFAEAVESNLQEIEDDQS